MSVITHVADVRSGVSYLDFEGRTFMQRYMHKAKHKSKIDLDSMLSDAKVFFSTSVIISSVLLLNIPVQ